MAELYIGNNKIGGGTTDLSNYYTKSEIDTSISLLDASVQNIIDDHFFLHKLTNDAGYSVWVPKNINPTETEKIKARIPTSGAWTDNAIVMYSPSGTYLPAATNDWGKYNSSSYSFGKSLAHGLYSLAQGSSFTRANYSHAEGRDTATHGEYSHAEGRDTSTNGPYSHAEGYYTNASATCSHAEGYRTTTSAQYQHVEGIYNENNSDALLIVGNGTDSANRHNALEVYQNGYVYLSDVTLASSPKPMFALQDRLSNFELRITTLEQNGGGSGGGGGTVSGDYVSTEDFNEVNQATAAALVNQALDVSVLKTTVAGYRDLITTETLILDNNLGVFPELYIRDSNGDLYQIDLDQLCANFGTLVAE